MVLVSVVQQCDLVTRVCMLWDFSHVWLCVTLWAIAPQAPLSMGFSRQEYWNGFPFPSPEHLPDPGMEPLSLTSLAFADWFFTASAARETPQLCICMYQAFFKFSSHLVITKYWIELGSRTLLVFCFKCSSVYMTIANSKSVPPPRSSLLVALN